MRTLLYAAAFAAVLAPAASAQTESRLDQIIARGTLRVGTTGDYKPFTYLDKATNQFSGMDIDLAENLGKALGVKVEFVHTSWPNLMKDFEADKFDIGMGGISVTLERQKKAYFSAPIMREGKTPVARCENKDKFQTLEQIDKPEVKVIVNPGGTNERFARGNLKSAKITVFADNTAIFDEIIKGNADLMMTDSSETLYQQKLHPELCAIHPDKPFDFAEKAYLLPRDMALKQFVDAWLHIARETGVYQAAFSKWLQ
ncbi:MAG TPA: transporter substrate-binding domain-containing protein [Pseudorhodoplanes sp.]|jgi:cyclohexadienyl dehydratase|nr:transporter substrate-binding domain-containing protein [Pseudorhodoplanes sp.]